MNIRIKPVSDDQPNTKQTSDDAISEDVGVLTALGFDAWAEEWKDNASENKVWEEFYKNQKRVPAG